MKKIMNFKTVFLALLSALFLVQGCADYRNLKIVSAKVDSISLKGLRSFGGKATVGVDNPSAAMNLYDIAGKVYISGRTIGTFTVGPITVPGKTQSECSVSGTFNLDNSVSLFEIFPMVTGLDVNTVTIDISGKLKVRGAPVKSLSFEGVPLSNYVKDASFLNKLGVLDLLKF